MQPPAFPRRTALALAWIALSLPAQAQPPAFEGLGVLPGATSSSAFAVSRDGSVVVGTSGTATAREAFRWDASSGMRGLGRLNAAGPMSEAHAVSADGAVVLGRSSGPQGDEAFAWSGAMSGLGDLPGGSFSSWARASSADGRAAAGQGQGAAGAEAFLWRAGSGLLGLGDLPGGSTRSEAYGISADGSVVVGRSSSLRSGTLWEAFRWDAAGGMVGLGDLPGGSTSSQALAVSADGAVVVGASIASNGEHAFRWTAAGGMRALGSLPGGDFSSAANATSADGAVVVGVATVFNPQTFASTPHAFLWTAEAGMRRLADILLERGADLAGWRLEAATGISGDGLTIAGRGVNPAGQSEAWVARLADPDPDLDADGVFDADDNCPEVANEDQADLDGDGEGDACDLDADGDLVADEGDNCLELANEDQADLDGDGEGDACDLDADGDAVADDADACPLTPLGALVLADGCGLEQLCPCEGPPGGGSWWNHGRYVSCVRQALREFTGEGLLSRREWFEGVRDAERSRCGVPERRRCGRDRDRDDDHRGHRHHPRHVHEPRRGR
jgi:probable HAF family extracellular repeat protein